MKNLKTMSLKEMKETEGGYSWAEFKADVKKVYDSTVAYLHECCVANNDPRSGIITQH